MVNITSHITEADFVPVPVALPAQHEPMQQSDMVMLMPADAEQGQRPPDQMPLMGLEMVQSQQLETLNDQPGGSKAPRWIITRPALYVLEQVFTIEKFPSHVMRQRLAQDLGVSGRQVRTVSNLPPLPVPTHTQSHKHANTHIHTHTNKSTGPGVVSKPKAARTQHAT